MKILLTGGGTMGSVMPLLAVAQKLKQIKPATEFLFLGTSTGPEKPIVEKVGLTFRVIPAGKLRRYFSLKNLLTPLWVLGGWLQSLYIIKKFKPDLIISAGGFVSVPVIWAAWLLRRPSIIHQEDVRPGLANLLTARFAKIITVTFEKSLADFPASKTVLTGNPYRPEILTGDKTKFQSNLPTVLILGGGTGALELNKIVIDALPELTKFCQIIHLIGKGKQVDLTGRRDSGIAPSEGDNNNYHPFEFLNEELKDAFAAADLVITRAGMSSLTELAVLGKPIIIVPIPGSHQEDNAQYFVKNNAALMLPQNNLTPEILTAAIKELLGDEAKRLELSRNIVKMMPRDATERLIEEILKFSDR